MFDWKWKAMTKQKMCRQTVHRPISCPMLSVPLGGSASVVLGDAVAAVNTWVPQE